MYLRYKSSLELEDHSRRKLFFVVAGFHIGIIAVLYIGFFVKNYFWNMAPQAIAVSLISPSEFSAVQNPPVAQPKKQQEVTKKQTKEIKEADKVPVKKKVLDASQIKKSTEVITKTPPKPQTPVQQQQTFKPLSAAELAATLQKSANSVKFTSAALPNAVVNPAMMGYYDQLSSYLYSCWEQPAKFAAGAQPPQVLVRLVISADGRLTNYQILKTSGYGDMDDSVRKFLSQIDKLPVPPDGPVTIEATMILTN